MAGFLYAAILGVVALGVNRISMVRSKPPFAAREISAAVTLKRKPKEHYPIGTSAISKDRGGLHR